METVPGVGESFGVIFLALLLEFLLRGAEVRDACGNLLALARKELDRTQTEAPEFVEAASMYVENLSASLDLWNNRYQRNLINAFRELQNEGVLEIITCCATHGFMPLISTPEARRAQIEIAVNNYKKHFGRRPRGIWHPGWCWRLRPCCCARLHRRR